MDWAISIRQCMDCPFRIGGSKHRTGWCTHPYIKPTQKSIARLIEIKELFTFPEWCPLLKSDICIKIKKPGEL